MDPAAERRGIPVYLLVTWTVSSLFYFLIIKSARPLSRALNTESRLISRLTSLHQAPVLAYKKN